MPCGIFNFSLNENITARKISRARSPPQSVLVVVTLSSAKPTTTTKKSTQMFKARKDIQLPPLRPVSIFVSFSVWPKPGHVEALIPPSLSAVRTGSKVFFSSLINSCSLRHAAFSFFFFSLSSNTRGWRCAVSFSRSMRWKGNPKAGLREGYCSESLEGDVVVVVSSSRRFSRNSQRSSLRMYRQRDSWCSCCSKKTRNVGQQQQYQHDRAQAQATTWSGGESFSHRALVRWPITLFASYDVIRGGQ